MKKTFLILAFFVALGAQAFAAVLNIRTNTNAPLKVVLDGHVVATNSATVSLNNLNAGYHNMQVFRVLQNYNSYNEEPIFVGQIFLPNQTVTNALVKQNQFIVEAQFALNTPAPQHNGNYYDNVSFGNSAYGQYYNTKPVTWNNNVYQNNNSIVCEHIPTPVVVHYNVPEVVQIFAMNPQVFNQLKASINNQWFSDGKMSVFNQAVQANYFTTAQVNELINLFSFSNDKLEVAKRAYTKTVDTENYFMVFDSLQWNSSIQNLSSYIASL